MAIRSHRLILVVAMALGACAAPGNRAAAPGDRTERLRPIAPVGHIEEAPLGGTSVAPPPPPSMPRPVDPAPEAPAPVATAMEPGPVVDQIGPATPPNVAAALQLIEEGRRLQTRGGRNQAREHFERAVAIDPTNAYGYFFLARVHFFNRNYDQAIAFASRAVALGARLDPPWLGRVYALQGAVFEEAGRYPDARAAYRRAVATDPHNLTAQVGLGRVTGGEETPPAP